MRNNQSFLKTAISFGLTAGVVLLFLSLIGFTPVVGQILFDSNKLKPFEYGTVLVLIGFVIGLLSANKVDKEKDWKTDLSSSAISSVVAGLMMSIFVLAMYFIDQSGKMPELTLVNSFSR